jgi:hypothetical protein
MRASDASMGGPRSKAALMMKVLSLEALRTELKQRA